MKKLLLFLYLLTGSWMAAQAPTPVVVRPIHEAYILRITDPIPQEIVLRQPPALIAETPPPQPNAQTIWIPGYWTWIRERQDFDWVCGVWRLPPADHIWSTGYWKEVNGGWTWVKGAWMPDQTKTQKGWTYSQKPPPAPQNEVSGNAPGSDYFWLSGYWEYVPARNDYQWLGGSWQRFNPNLILEAGHWQWRPEGYLFVPTYWDWKLEERGLLYDCKSQQPLAVPAIVKLLTPYYPDYIGEMCYYWHYRPQIWDGCSCVPPWWGWDDWWTLPWNNQWGLWWWWWNPGFPAPIFLPGGFIDLIPPPGFVIIDIFGPFPVPIFITPFGIPSLFDWISAINQALGSDIGLELFITPDTIGKILDILDKIIPDTTKDRPNGKPNGQHPTKPTSPGTLTPPAGSAQLPPPPNTINVTPVPTPTAPVPPPPTYTPPPTPIQPVDPTPTPPSGYGGYTGSYTGSYGGYTGGYTGDYYGGYSGGYTGSYGGYTGGYYGGYVGGYDGGGRHGGYDGGGHHGGYDGGGRHGGYDGGGHHGGGHHGDGGGRQGGGHHGDGGGGGRQGGGHRGDGGGRHGGGHHGDGGGKHKTLSANDEPGQDRPDAPESKKLIGDTGSTKPTAR